LKTVIKKIVSFPFWNLFLKKKRFVFLFHDISEKKEIAFSEHYSTSPESFNDQIVFLKKQFNIVTIHDITDPNLPQSTRPYATITFDDGFYSVYSKAYPFLKEHKIPFTIFVNKSAVLQNHLWFSELLKKNESPSAFHKSYDLYVDKDKISFDQFCRNLFQGLNFIDFDLLSKQECNTSNDEKVFCGILELNEMVSSGLLTLGSHTKNHYTLSKCNNQVLSSEILENATFLKDEFNMESSHFAIPFGKKEHYDQRMIDPCIKAGHKYVFTTNPIPFSRTQLNSDYVILPRISILNEKPGELRFLINRSIFKKIDL
jgi:peptidoglycan/xylan/chitin deacetylase (PgdA/CDA1 family)